MLQTHGFALSADHYSCKEKSWRASALGERSKNVFLLNHHSFFRAQFVKYFTSRCHRFRRFSPSVRAFIFYAHRVEHSHCSSIFIQACLLTLSRFPLINFYARKKSRRACALGECIQRYKVFFFSTSVLLSFFAQLVGGFPSRGHRCRRFSPSVRAFIFIAHRVEHSHCLSIFIECR